MTELPCQMELVLFSLPQEKMTKKIKWPGDGGTHL